MFIVRALAALVAAALPRLGAAQPQWTLVEELRFGNGESEAYTFSDIRGIGVGAGGRIFVLDHKVQEIRLFDASGRFIKLAARRGAGPGEISSANGIAHGPDGSIWVNDFANSRYTVFKPDGSFLRQHVVPMHGFAFIWDGAVDANGRVTEPMFGKSARSESIVRLRRVGPDGTAGDTLDTACNRAGSMPPVWTAASKSGSRMIMGIPFTAVPWWRYDPRGFLWCSAGDAYRVARVRLGSSDTVAVAERKGPPVPVSSAERAERIAGIDSSLRRFDSNNVDYSQIPKTKPAIEGLYVDDSGRLWVRRPSADKNTTILDVFDDRGRFLASARAPFRLDANRPPVIRGDLVYAVALDEDDVQQIVRARIRR